MVRFIFVGPTIVSVFIRLRSIKSLFSCFRSRLESLFQKSDYVERHNQQLLKIGYFRNVPGELKKLYTFLTCIGFPAVNYLEIVLAPCIL